jgi:hypothetical protein
MINAERLYGILTNNRFRRICNASVDRSDESGNSITVINEKATSESEYWRFLGLGYF